MKNTIVLLVASAAVAVAVQPGFDPKDVVRQVRGAGHVSPRVKPVSIDDGEFVIDTAPTYVPPPSSQNAPAIAFDGTNYFVVWEDYRSGDTSDIYGARVGQTGVVLDPAGIVISTAAHYRFAPDIAFDGTNYLVVWMDWRNGDTSDICGARVSQTGVVLDPAGIAVSTAAGNQEHPSLAFDGTNFLVVWDDRRSGPDSFDIYGTRVSQTGVVFDPAGIAISTSSDFQCYPSLAFDGTNFLVVWDDRRSGNGRYDIYGARVSRAGAVLDPSGIAISTATNDQWHPSLAFDGTNFLVAWDDYRNGSSYDIYGTRVSRAGAVLDTSGIAISTTAASQCYPSLAFDGENYLVAWHDYRSVDWEDIYGARVDRDGVVLDPSGIAISTAANNQAVPALAFDGTNYLAVWDDGRCGSGLSDVYGARVSQAGVALDPSGIAVSTAASYQECPSLAFDGKNYLVVWQDYRSSGAYDIYGARVSQAGVVLDPAGIAISTTADYQNDPAIAFDGTNYLVVWMEERDGRDIYGARVSRAGIVLDPAGIAISTAANCKYAPALAFDGVNYLVVWMDGRNYDFDIYGARVSRDGVVLDLSGIAISTAANGQLRPSLAFDGTSFLVVWEDRRGGSAIYGARVSRAGVVLDSAGIPISTVLYDLLNPLLAFDGANYLVVWEDLRSGLDNADIYGARVRPSGMVYDEGPVVRQEGSQTHPALCRGNGGQMFLAYQGWAGTVAGKPYNTDRIWGKVNPAPGVAEIPQPTAYGPPHTATIVRGLLYLPTASGVERGATSVLLDASGRKVLALRPGPNSVKALAPGVYFMQKGGRGKTQKVLIVE